MAHQQSQTTAGRAGVRVWVVLGVFTLALLAGPGGPAAAYETWCADDPLVSIEGRLLDIQVQVPAGQLVTMRATTLTVVIPHNATGEVLLAGVSAFPMRTTIATTGPRWDRTGALPVTVVVKVEATARFPIRLTATPLLNLTMPAAPATMAEGTTNVPLRVALTLP